MSCATHHALWVAWLDVWLVLVEAAAMHACLDVPQSTSAFSMHSQMASIWCAAAGTASPRLLTSDRPCVPAAQPFDVAGPAAALPVAV